MQLIKAKAKERNRQLERVQEDISKFKQTTSYQAVLQSEQPRPSTPCPEQCKRAFWSFFEIPREEKKI